MSTNSPAYRPSGPCESPLPGAPLSPTSPRAVRCFVHVQLPPPFPGTQQPPLLVCGIFLQLCLRPSPSSVSCQHKSANNHHRIVPTPIRKAAQFSYSIQSDPLPQILLFPTMLRILQNFDWNSNNRRSILMPPTGPPRMHRHMTNQTCITRIPLCGRNSQPPYSTRLPDIGPILGWDPVSSKAVGVAGLRGAHGRGGRGGGRLGGVRVVRPSGAPGRGCRGGEAGSC